MRRVAIGAVGVVLVVGLVVVLLVGNGSDDTGPDAGDRVSAEPFELPDGLVYRGKDVATAVEGEDYEVLAHIPGHLAYRVTDMLPDGSLVLYSGGRYNPDLDRFMPDRLELLDPGTGRREMLPVRQIGRYTSTELSVTSATDIWISWNPRHGAGFLRRAAHYDRTTGEESVYTAPRIARARTRHWNGLLRPGGDGRLYFMTGDPPCHDTECPGSRRRELWSFAPNAPGRVRKEGQGAVDFAVSDKLLAYVTYDGDGTMRLRVRRLGRPQVHQATLTDCWLSETVFSSGLAVVLAADDVVLTGCGRVYDDRARRLATFEYRDHHDLAGVSTRRWVAYGRTVLDTRTGRLIRIAEDRLWHDRAVVMSGNRILFPTGTEPRNTRNGTWTLARLIPR